MRTLALIGVLILALAGPAGAATLKVAVAASTQEAIKEIAHAYERESGYKVTLSFGSSGKLATQLAQGAPFDLFFSADDEYPRKLHAQGICEKPVRYAHGRIVVWVPQDSALDPSMGLELLKDAQIDRLAIANPRVAPYGRAAEQAMRHAKVYEAVATKLVLGENVSQTSQFVEAGAAPVAILPLSLAVSPKLAPRGRYWLIPASAHDPIVADAAVVSTSKQKGIARQFLDFLTGPKALPVWKRFGLAG